VDFAFVFLHADLGRAGAGGAVYSAHLAKRREKKCDESEGE
jgi:hypothetical protein